MINNTSTILSFIVDNSDDSRKKFKVQYLIYYHSSQVAGLVFFFFNIETLHCF